jgi:hypothetical protein
MAHGDRRKCKVVDLGVVGVFYISTLCCLKLFRPDPRIRYHQRCSVPACRTASKVASQAHWLAKPENQGYFRGSINVGRVHAWRSRHPGYWRKGRRAGVALQDLLTAQPIGSASETNKPAHTPLQDLIIAQPVGFANETASSAQTPLQEILLAQRAVLIGLIAHIVGTTFEG